MQKTTPLNTKITETFVKNLPFVNSNQKIYWDTELKGFGISVGKKTKTFVVQRDINGRSSRTSIGRYGIYKVEQARKKARMALIDMSEGINLNLEKKRKRDEKVSLEDICDEYIKIKSKTLSPRSIRGYEDFLKNHLSDWRGKHLKDITRGMIEKRFLMISETAGPYAANNTMDYLRAIFNFASIDNEDLRNPVDILKLKKLKNKRIRRQTAIPADQLSDWYEAVLRLENQTFRDVLILMLFTGLRKMEAFKLRWNDIDFDRRLFVIPETKNGKALTLPMSSFTQDLLLNRFENKTSDVWVFPGKSKEGHITEAKKAVNNIIRQTGIKFMLHDLRRTFATQASNISIPERIIKLLLNHARSNDVTDGYIVTNIDDIREPNQKITDAYIHLIEK